MGKYRVIKGLHAAPFRSSISIGMSRVYKGFSLHNISYATIKVR